MNKVAVVLSKTRLQAFRQCPRRLWLEIHHPERQEDSVSTQEAFSNGKEIGEAACRIYDVNGKGVEVDRSNVNAAIECTANLLRSRRPIFEAGFQAEGARAFADVLLPVTRKGRRVWRMVEVKSSTKLKDYHHDDVAIQAFIARNAGLPLAGISLAHVDGSWIYPGGGDYDGLLVERDLTGEAFARDAEVRTWIKKAQAIVKRRAEPVIHTGEQCGAPCDCGFLEHCRKSEKQAKHPLSWLPDVRNKELKAFIAAHPDADMSAVPDALLNDRQRRVKAVTLSGKPFFDAQGAAGSLRAHKLPAYFVDFETIAFAVPRWKGLRPYQHVPFQFSAHRLTRSGRLEHEEFLDLSGKDPSKAFAEALIAACGERGPIFVYSHFESGRLKELASRFPRLEKNLLAIDARIVDLLPLARAHYYHPGQRGSWSIKAVLPAICPDLSYDQLAGIKDGSMAMAAYREALDKDTPTRRKTEIKQQLLDYCRQDTYASVRLWAKLSGQNLKSGLG
jgi:hypothetical protein